MCAGKYVLRMNLFRKLLMFQVFLHLGGCTSEFTVMELAYKDQIQKLQEIIEKNNNRTSDDLSTNILFYLYTKGYEFFDTLTVGDTASLRKSKYDATKPTKVLIHGWMDYVHGDMITTVKEGFLKGAEDVNILAVDWSALSVDLNYITAAERTGEAGRYVAEMVDFLVGQGARLDSFHLVGHSLGAHVAGEAGAAIRAGRPPRVTGLDPALPGFGLIRIARRLEKSDGRFVDCIHTCGRTLGIWEPFCQADFYPNGGEFNQPGCSLTDFGLCSHFRAFEFFAESIIRNHTFPALRCDKLSEWSKFCYESPHVMGYPVDTSAQGPYYVHTNSDYPFAPHLST